MTMHQRRDLFKLAEGITHRRVVGHARYSSILQKDGWTIQAQTYTLTDHCQTKDFSLVTITKDEAKSGKTLRRDGLDEALDLIRAGEANVLMVCKLDRATRDAFDAFGMERELRSLGAALYCIEQNIDTGDPQSFLTFGVHALMAQHYRMNLGTETTKGKQAHVKGGLSNGDVHVGYRRATAADLLDFAGTPEELQERLRKMPHIVVPERAEPIKLAFEWYATGQYSDAQIAATLNEAGYRMVSTRYPDGAPFQKDTITAILRDPYYAGTVAYAGYKTHGKLDLALRRRHGKAEESSGKHKRIIEPDLFAQVQAMRAQNYKPGNPRTRQTHVYVAQKLARCTVCGELLRGNPARDRSVYRNASPERGIACTAQRRSIDGAIVTEALADFGLIQLPEEWQATALAAALSGEAAQRRQSAREKLERQLARLHELKYDPDTDLQEWRVRKAAVEAELDTLRDEPALDVDMAAVAERLAHLDLLWMDATAEERREIVAGIVMTVWCDLDKGAVVAIQPQEEFYPLRVAFPHTSHDSLESSTTHDDGCTVSSRSGTDGHQIRGYDLAAQKRCADVQGTKHVVPPRTAAVTSPRYFPVWCHDCGKESEEGNIIVLFACRRIGRFRTHVVTTLYCLRCYPLISHMHCLHPELRRDSA